MNTGSSAPSAAAAAIAAALVAGTVGYFLGQATSIGLFQPSASRRHSGKKEKASWPNSYDVAVHPDSSDEELMTRLKAGNDVASESEDDSEDDLGELESFAGNKEECKLILVVRTDLGMGKGKIAAQCSHATLACYQYLTSRVPKSSVLKQWFALGQAKVAVQCKSEEELLTLQAQALSLGLCARVIRDAGRTQIASGSVTVLGVGPGPKSVVDQVTGSLKLL